ncbi:hypothetical protein CEXT_712711 [Caerostris extrusa]|uniref:Uncharacterized protein n=1 Tax=Caerostris extrusa TaxID=172846 RepID=A0AAV4XFS2_CAEEX|nr:hypothetical protein CEXT_712711 [Caerostris extrusa]
MKKRTGKPRKDKTKSDGDIERDRDKENNRDHPQLQFKRSRCNLSNDRNGDKTMIDLKEISEIYNESSPEWKLAITGRWRIAEMENRTGIKMKLFS